MLVELTKDEIKYLTFVIKNDLETLENGDHEHEGAEREHAREVLSKIDIESPGALDQLFNYVMDVPSVILEDGPDEYVLRSDVERRKKQYEHDTQA